MGQRLLIKGYFEQRLMRGSLFCICHKPSRTDIFRHHMSSRIASHNIQTGSRKYSKKIGRGRSRGNKRADLLLLALLRILRSGRGGSCPTVILVLVLERNQGLDGYLQRRQVNSHPPHRTRPPRQTRRHRSHPRSRTPRPCR